jgi:hypothetical protein
MIKLSIDLTKIDKSKIKEHQNGGKYYEIIVDERKEADQYGNTHTVYEGMTKEERESGKKKNYLGNAKEYVFGQNTNTPPAPAQNNFYPPATDLDLPF